ncbi:MAG: non-canonical purine NTP pyrophosphatase [Verrucomicrobiales bacterium]
MTTKPQIVLATRNRHKAEEIAAILGKTIDRIRIMADFSDAPELEEKENSFEGNATSKAVQLANWLKKHYPNERGLVLADDSGLEVDFLGGAPGIHSARFAAMDIGQAGNSKDPDNNAKLMRLLQAAPPGKRSARFRCVLALTPLDIDESKVSSPACDAQEAELRTELFRGICEGKIIAELRGKGGFGYDPLFIPEGFEQTFAELGEETKNQISHRAKALEQLKRRLAL